MCKISNEIKFCTCANESYTELENCWVIYRRKEVWSRLGQTVFNQTKLKLGETEINTIERNLNSKKMFDFEYTPEEDDKLKIKLTYKNKCSEYDFKYLNGRWSVYKEAPLDWMLNPVDKKPEYIEEFKGKIENPFR